MFCVIISVVVVWESRGWIKGRTRCKFSLSYCSCRLWGGGWSPGVIPRKKNENKECRRSHLRPFFNAIKVSNLPEFSPFADASEEKIPISFMLLNVFEHNVITYRQKSTSICVDPGNIYNSIWFRLPSWENCRKSWFGHFEKWNCTYK